MFFIHCTATTEIYTLSLHDALPICRWKAGHVEADLSDDDAGDGLAHAGHGDQAVDGRAKGGEGVAQARRSEEHTSELQSHSDLVCRLLLEKKKQTKTKSKEIENDKI